MSDQNQSTPADDDPMRTATYMRGFRNGMNDAANMLRETASSVRLHAGELSAQEMRAVRAILAWKIAEITDKAETEWRRVMGKSA